MIHSHSPPQPRRHLVSNELPALSSFSETERAEFRTVNAYLYELDHTLMGFFPAVVAGTGEIVVCLDPILLERVKDRLPRRRCKRVKFLALVSGDGTYGYDLSSGTIESATSFHILTHDEFERCVSQERPFKWAPGLISNDMTREEFMETLAAAETQAS